MIGGVLFDLGSTLIYSAHDQNWGAVMPRMQADLLAHLNTHGYALAPEAFFSRLRANYAVFDQQRQSDWVEYTASYLIATTLADLGAPAPAPDVLAEAVKAYFAYSETLYEPMPGAHATLRELQAAGLRLGLISNASDAGNVQRLIDNAGLREYFDPILISAAVGLRKPNPRIFQLALTAWGLPPAAVVMVGDTLGADILGAQLAGLRHVWLSARADGPANRAHRGNIVPEAEIRALAELPPLIREWSNGL
jgi:haloacid dehalogenase superfamily, subfamily IA, variant 3 with third motif having DD or ED/haloacid dehalogenase superfamily, subfamily IA, variant 1 with third motif having Dx(3-4)D or Dx(3-4)E